MAAGVTRIYFKFPLNNNVVVDVTDSSATISGSTQGSGVATVGGRAISVTRARDSKTLLIAVDNIAGWEALPVVA